MASFVRGNMMDQFRKPITALKRANGASSGGVGREAGGGAGGQRLKRRSLTECSSFSRRRETAHARGACRDCFTGATFSPWRLSLPTPRKGVGVGSKHRGGKILPAPTCDTAATRAPLLGHLYGWLVQSRSVSLLVPRAAVASVSHAGASPPAHAVPFLSRCAFSALPRLLCRALPPRLSRVP